jgi:pyruvate formate lyase activating enzyme
LKGIIFNIEEFAVHDGPGIRKMVFLKGCPLRCSWCHNPEGISFRPELMVSYAACISCGKCSDSCINKESCIVCGKCVEVCPLRLRRISGQVVEAKDLAAKLLKGKEVLVNSGGGITISGGEPLAQPGFLFELIRWLKPVNIAVETSGFAEAGIFKRLISEADLILMDIKHTDPEIHRKYTGAGNSQILKNLQLLCQASTDFYVRIPLIPGVNDSPENISRTIQLIKYARHLRRVELLAYNQAAGAKYGMLRKKYNPGFNTAREANVVADDFRKHNITVNVL